MYVCICNAITEQQIRQVADDGVSDLWGLQAALGVAGNCGSCRDIASEILAEKRAEKRTGKMTAEPRLYVPSVA